MTADPFGLHACEGENCGGPHSGDQVQWCQAWGTYLCSQCRYIASETELRMTLAEKQAPRG